MAGPVWKATEPQLQSENLSFGGGAQLEDRAAIWELETFWWQVQLEGNRTIWELDIFLVAGPGTLFSFDRQSLGARVAPAYKTKMSENSCLFVGWAISSVMWDLIFLGGHLSISCLWLFYTSIVYIEMNVVVSTSVVRLFTLRTLLFR